MEYFILLIDESLRLAEGIDGDAYNGIRGAVLDIIFKGNFHAGLVITSLAAGPISLTRSGRTVCIVDKPSKLPVIPTLLEWLRMVPSSSACLFVTLLTPVPRSVQILYHDVIKELFTNQEITTANFQYLFENLVRHLRNVFRGAKFPSDEMIFEILFKNQIVVTAEVQQMVMDSVLTNVMGGAIIGDSEIVPEPSLLMMYTSVGKAGFSDVAKQFVRTVDKTLGQLSAVRSDNVGTVLEVLYFEYLYMRILATNCGNMKVSPANLLGINSKLVRDFGLQDMLESSVSRFFFKDLMDSVNYTLPSLSTTKDFSRFIAELPADQSIGLWRSAKGDPFDCLLMLRLDGFPDPFFFFLELKSRKVSYGDKEGDTTAFKDRAQFKRCQALVKDVIGKLPEDALLKADGYLYTYFVADDNIESKFFKENRRMLISGTEAMRFLGLFNDFYRAIRGLVDDPILSLPKDSAEG